MSQELHPFDDEGEPEQQCRNLPQPGVWLAIPCSILFVVVLLGTSLCGALVYLACAAVTNGNISQLLGQEGQAIFQGPDSLVSQRAMSLGMFAGHMATLALALAAAQFFHGSRWPLLFGLHRFRLVHLVLSLLLLPGLMTLHAGIHEFMNWLANMDSEQANRDIINMFHSWPRVFMIAIVGIGPGVVEELWCRGVLGRGLVARHGVFLGVLLASIIFGAMHVSPLYAVGTAFMGVGLHTTYLLTRSLWIPIILHILNNTITALATVGDIPLSHFQQGSARPSFYVYFAAFFLTAAGFWALVSCREKVGENGVAEPSQFPRIAPTLLAVIAFVFLGYSILKHT